MTKTSSRASSKEGSHVYRPNRSSRDQYPAFLLLCEGAKTEVEYFRELRGALGLSRRVVQIDTWEGRPSTLRRKILEARRSGEYDMDDIWCVVDVDSPQVRDERSALIKKTRRACHVAFSNPSFEYWLLLHFCCKDRPYGSAKKVIAHLKHYFPDYEKSGCPHDQLMARTRAAVENSHQVLANSSSADGWADPSTNMHQLVQRLVERADRWPGE